MYKIVQVTHQFQSPNPPTAQAQTYAAVTSGQPSQHFSPPPVLDTSPHLAPDITAMLASFMNDFKSLINPLISLLTKIISNLLDKKNE